ncbi:MAG: ribonuclease D, partial [Leptonema sp. (in: Bacteria)]|nr:ribonuclease D [Leptonema sp. (in: bacteria)]
MERARLVKQDLPTDIFEEFNKATELGVDCEMMGLNPHRDRLCLLQISRESGSTALVQIDESQPPTRLKQILENQQVRKIF